MVVRYCMVRVGLTGWLCKADMPLSHLTCLRKSTGAVYSRMVAPVQFGVSLGVRQTAESAQIRVKTTYVTVITAPRYSLDDAYRFWYSPISGEGVGVGTLRRVRVRTRSQCVMT